MSILLRNYIRNFMGALNEAGLGDSLFDSKKPQRVEAMVQMLKDGEAFEMVDGRLVVIDPKYAAALLKSLNSRNYPAYLKTLESGITAREVDEDRKIIKKAAPVVIDSLSQFLKTRKLGSTQQSERERAAAIARGETPRQTGSTNESGFASTITSLVAKNGGAGITIRLGDQTFTNVTSAEVTGGTKGDDGLTSKADVVLNAGGKRVGLSLKIDSAQYLLSGDWLLADIALPIISMIEKLKENPPANPKRRVELTDVSVRDPVTNKVVDKRKQMTDEEGKAVNITFPLTDEIKEKAAFGVTKENSIDWIVKGNLEAAPKKEEGKKGTVYVWNVKCLPPVLESLGDDFEPVGLIRHDSGRNFQGYKGIRVAVVNKSRAKSAVDINDLYGSRDKTKYMRDLASQQLRKPKYAKDEEAAAPAATKSRKKPVGRTR